ILFLFIGGGAQLDWIEDEVRRRGLKNIMLKPYQPREQLGLSLSVPDIHLISLEPSMEGLIVPSKFYGIAAAGRPAIFIGSTNGEIPYILEKAQCGFSIGKGQAEKLSYVIQKLADHRDSCVSLGVRARELFDRQFEMRHALDKWETILNNTIRNSMTR